MSKPNIILITLDTVRADHVSCYGYERQTTPNLDAFSREAVLYKNAYAPSPWTLASHASMFTGMYPAKHGAHFNTDSVQIAKYFESQKNQLFDMSDLNTRSILKLSEENMTLAEILSERGYRTAGIIGGPFTSSIFGLAQGFDYYDEHFLDVEKDISFSLIYQVVDFFFSLKDFIIQSGYSAVKRLASQLNKTAFQWLAKNHEQPFFLFINYFDAHTPYIPPPAYCRYFGKVKTDIIMKHWSPKTDLSYCTAESSIMFSIIDGNHQLTPEEKELFISRYDAEIRYLDHCLGLLLKRLKDLKVYDNTLIIITSDHGEAFGEHSLVSHGRTLYEELLRVPLIIKYPSNELQRGAVEKRVSLVDLFPTILSFLDYPIPSGIDGENLGSSNHPVIAEWYHKWWDPEKYRRDLKTLYQGKLKYIWASNGLNELYDLESDPGEENNLIEKFSSKAQEMQSTLNQWLASFKPPGAEGKAVKINKSTEEKLRALGYVR
jgi:arylsulfatase A-like enzyme